jgi:hypothetical protein
MIVNKVSNPLSNIGFLEQNLGLNDYNDEHDLKESNKGKETQIKQTLFPCLELSYLAILTINTNLLKFIA